MHPDAHLVHRLPGRVRVRVPEKRRDEGWFRGAQEALSALEGVERVEANPLAASLLILGSVGLEDVRDHAAREGLFRLARPRPPEPLTAKARGAYEQMNRKVVGFTGGELDLTNLALIALIGVGGYQLARGGPSVPAWYIALWYALTILWQAGGPEVEEGLEALPVD